MRNEWGAKCDLTHSDDATTYNACIMLQKLLKCEVKAVRYGHFSNLLPLRFYVKSNVDVIKHSKNANFRGPELGF